MTFAALLMFATVYLVAVASPGPGLALVLARGLSVGTRNGVFFIAGFVLGDLIWFAAAAAGLAVVARTHEWLFTLIRYAGCVYLLLLAWKIWHARVDPAALETSGGAAIDVSPLPSFLSSLALTLGNPKVIVFFLAIMPLVVELDRLTLSTFLELSVVVVLVISSIMALALVLASRVRRLFRSERALIRVNRLTATMMAGVAVAIAARS